MAHTYYFAIVGHVLDDEKLGAMPWEERRRFLRRLRDLAEEHGQREGAPRLCEAYEGPFYVGEEIDGGVIDLGPVLASTVNLVPAPGQEERARAFAATLPEDVRAMLSGFGVWILNATS